MIETMLLYHVLLKFLFFIFKGNTMVDVLTKLILVFSLLINI